MSRSPCGIPSLMCTALMLGEVRKTGLHSKVVKFDHFEIRVMNHLPSSKELNGIACAYPVLNDVSSTALVLLAVCHISQRYIVLVVVGQDGNLSVLNNYLSHISFLFSSCLLSFFHHRAISEGYKLELCSKLLPLGIVEVYFTLLSLTCIFGLRSAYATPLLVPSFSLATPLLRYSLFLRYCYTSLYY